MPGLLTLHWQHSRLEKWNGSTIGQQLLFFWNFSRFLKQTDKQMNEHKAAIALALISNSKLGSFLGEADSIQKTAGSEKVSCPWSSAEMQGLLRGTHQPPWVFCRWSAQGRGWDLRLYSSRSCSGWVADGNPGSPWTSPRLGSMGETERRRQIFFWLD